MMVKQRASKKERRRPCLSLMIPPNGEPTIIPK